MVSLKTYLRNKRITREDVAAAYEEFSKGRSSSKRRDVRAFLKIPREKVIDAAFQDISGRSVELDPIRYRERRDRCNGKMRVIGIETPMNQFYDYIAVTFLEPLFRAKIGEYQIAGVKGRGSGMGRRAVKRWVRRSKWFCHMDIRKCYQSADKSLVMTRLERDCGSADALYLVRAILATHRDGLSIGSILSLRLMNYYLFGAYLYCSHSLSKDRRGRTVRLVSHVLFQMDDILLMGNGKRDLAMACRMLEGRLSEMGLSLKPWKVCRVGEEPVDILGWRFLPGRTTIRKRLFRKIRRCFVRLSRSGPIGSEWAGRAISYWGFIRWSDCIGFRRSVGADPIMRRCRRIVTVTMRVMAGPPWPRQPRR